jgi:oxygen-independent coproporphyrinogen-3 oxidase
MHLYVHVPFCARRCSYCDFAIAVRSTVPSREFAQAIGIEWDTRRAHPSITSAAALQTLYFGGGTPSRIDGDALATVIERITRDLPLAVGAEVTVEANPDDISPAIAEAWVRAGVNRVSLGMQSHDPAVLAWMHRTHRAEQVRPAIEMLRAGGLSNISVDLIFALPPEVRRDWSRDLAETFALEPDHISLYGLTVEPHTPLARWTARGLAHAADETVYAAQYLTAHRELLAHGFEHYEVSNAGLPGRRSRHNTAYWSGAEYVGLGPSAHSMLRGTRSWNIREWAAYQQAVTQGASLTAGEETLTTEQSDLESVYLGLRTGRGLPEAALPAAEVARWVEAGWASADAGTVRLTATGWLRLDALVSRVAVP